MCRTMNVTQSTFYRWRRKYERTVENEPRTIGDVRMENRQLKRIMAELLVGRHGSTGRRGELS